MNLITLILLIKIGYNSVTKLTSSEVNTQTLNTNNQLEFGFGSFFSYSPIPYYITKYGEDNQNYLFLGSLKSKQTKKIKILHYCDILESEKQIIHKFKLGTGEVFTYEITNPKVYEGQWYFYYIKYSTTSQTGTIQISDASLTNNQIFNIPSNGLIDQSEYIIQYTGVFEDEINTKYSYFTGLIYKITQTSDYTVTQSKLLQDASSAKYTCYTDYNVQNVYIKYTDPPIQQQFVDQGCSDYAIESWIKLINLPIYSYWEAEVFQVAHNKFDDYFAHAGGNAFKLKYVYDNKKINLNVQTYSYTFPSLVLSQTQIDDDTVQHTFEDIKIDLLQWHFFRFKKVSTTTQFQLYYPQTDLTLLHDFGKLYQFTRPFFTYYLGRNPQNDISYGIELSNFTIYNRYSDKSFTLKCFSQCQTCSGPTLYDCTSCYEGSHRLLKDNKCVCQMGYIELYNQCYSPPSDTFNISSIKLDIPKEGYEQMTPNLKCQFGYFPYEDQCIKCPQPITDQFIGCSRCVLRSLNNFFYGGFNCDYSMIKQGLSFIETAMDAIQYRYSLGDLIVLVETEICNLNDSKCFRGIHSTEEDQGQKCQSLNFYLNYDGFCSPIQPVIYQNFECGQFCENCDTNSLKCFRCLDPSKFYITSDGINCELCTIPNCKYCTLEDSENQNFEIYSLDFTPVSRYLDTLRVVCARCQNQYIFNYQTLACETAIPISNCELYYKDSKQQPKCILSQELAYSYTIQKCQNYISHCQYCTVSQYTLEAICLEWELYFYQLDINSASTCPSDSPCFKDDFDRHDKWKLEIQPYYYNYHSITDLIRQQTSYFQNDISRDTCQLIDIYNNICLSCKSDDYATPRSSLSSGNCRTCPYLCQACDDLSDQEINAMNPQFNSKYQDLQYMSTTCYKKISDSDKIYIDSNMRSLLCSDNQPCKIIGTQELLYPNCFKLLMALSFRSISQYDSQINTKTLLERGVSSFTFEWSLNSPTKCELIANILSNLQFQVISLNETQFILKGATETSSHYLTASFLIKDFTYVCLKNFVILDSIKNNLKINHTSLYTDFDLLNNVFIDWTLNYPIETYNIRNFKLINNTFNNMKFKGQSIIIFTQINQLVESIIIEDIIFQNCEFNDSYLLNLDENQVNSQFIMKLKNIKLVDCIFRNFTFFNLMIQQADIQINNIEFVNITTYEFNFINSTFTNLSTFYNLSIQSSYIKQQSAIIISNYIQLQQFTLRENLFEESSLYTMLNDSSTSLIFDQFYFQNNRIEGQQPLIKLTDLNNKITISNMRLENLTCSDQQFNYYPLFQFQANIFEIYNLDIIQPKIQQKLLFNIHNTNLLTLYNINIQNKDTIDKILTTTYECFSQQDTQGIFSLMDISQIDLSQVYIVNVQAINNALFTIIFSDKYKSESQKISIKDISVSDTILVKTKQNIQISLFYIGTAQNLQLSLTDSNFTTIWMHHYYTDNVICSTILTLIAPYSQINLNNLRLNRILATNTSNSIFQLDCRAINMSNILASELNYLTYLNFKRFLTINLQLTNNIYMEDFNLLFSIQSLGGFSNCQTENMFVNNMSISQIKSHSGGLFYIKTKSNGVISIQNSRFTNIQGDLLSQVSNGGLLYIDSSSSLLELTIDNIISSQTFSWQYGGLIYIIPSVQKTAILLTNNRISNSFSSQGSILYGEFHYRSTAQIIINNLTISDQNIDNFINKLQVQNEKEITEILKNFYLFDHLYCTKFTIKHSQFNNLKYVNFLNLQNTASLIIYDVKFNQIYFMKPSFLSIVNSYIKSSIILLDKLIIQDSSYFTYDETSYSVKDLQCRQYISQNYQQQCSEDAIIPTDIIYYSDIYNIDIFNCNINTIHLISTKQNYSALLQISIYENIIYFRSTNLFINNVTVTQQKGLINLQINNNHQNHIELFDTTFRNSECGIYGCLNLFNSDISDNLDSVINNITQVRDSQSQSPNRMLAEDFSYIILYNFQFYNNNAYYGTGILSININTNITNCLFHNNFAKYAGGAIYVQQLSNKLIIENIFLSNNQADQGSDIFIKGNQEKIDLSSNQGISVDSKKSLSSRPVSLSIKAINGIILEKINIEQGEFIRDQVYIKPFKIYGIKNIQHHLMYPSGQSISTYTYFDTQSQTYIPYNLSLQILAFNEKFEQVVNLDGSSCNLYQKQSNGQGEFQPLTNRETVYYDTQTNSYNLDNYTFIFDPIIENDLHLIIKVKCDSILYDNYELLFTVQTFQCQMGEYYFQSQCLVCDPEQSYYSLDPSKGKCDIKNDQTTLNIKSAMVQLKENYWRPMVQSSQIVYCLNNPSNCLGGWNVGDMSCKPGFIGALCEECDLWNLNGYGRFGKTIDYNCDLCEDFQYIYLKTLFLVLWVYFSVFITCQSVNNSNINIKKQQVLNPAFYKLLHSLSVDKTGIILKMLTNFVQIISAIQSFHITLNLNLDFAFGMVGNPVKQITTLLDCLISQYIDFDIVYYKMILMACLVLFLIQFGIIAYILIICSKKSTYNSSNLWVLLIFIYLFTQSGLVFDLSSLLGYREIANIKWVKGAVYLEYDTINHLLWILRVVVPIAGFFQLLIPGIMFYELYRNRKRLFEINFRKRFSYLINEYKESAWFWEIIKLFQRTYIIANLNLYSDETLIKSTQIFLAIVIYWILLYFFQPYSQRPLIELEMKSTIVQLCSIILAATIYQSQLSGNQIYYFYVLILILIVAAQMLIFLFEISRGYFEKLRMIIETVIYKKLSHGHINLPTYLEEYFRQKQLRKTQLEIRFKKLRGYLRTQTKFITEARSKQNQSIYPIRVQKSDFNYTDILLSPKSDKQEEMILNNQFKS